MLNWIKSIFDKLFPAKRLSNVRIDSNFPEYRIQGKRALRIINYYNDHVDIKCNLKRKISIESING
jgi:hypothetical protein